LTAKCSTLIIMEYYCETYLFIRILQSRLFQSTSLGFNDSWLHISTDGNI